MQFYEKLDCLMKLTDLSNSELSKRTNIDPSLISRWRRGIKAPDVFSDTLNRVAEVLARRINNDLRRREFAMLKSVGMTQKGFRRMMNCECLLYGSKALLLGLPVSCGITYLIYRAVTTAYETFFHLPWAAIGIAVL